VSEVLLNDREEVTDCIARPCLREGRAMQERDSGNVRDTYASHDLAHTLWVQGVVQRQVRGPSADLKRGCSRQGGVQNNQVARKMVSRKGGASVKSSQRAGQRAARLPSSRRLRGSRLFYSSASGLGRLYMGDAAEILGLPDLRRLRGKVKLIFTSPPFPLKKAKAYGNLQGRKYILWLASMAEELRTFLHPKGSIVVEIGNAWDGGKPTFSTFPIEALLEFKRAGNYELCQEFISFNPARLPTPAHWVTVKRTRVKDAFTRLWWMSTSPFPDANNSRVLVPYSKDMLHLLRTRKYNAGTRPSEHRIRPTSFLTDNGGAIPPNVFQIGGTGSRDPYLTYCKQWNLEIHPARMPMDVARFFIKFLTEKGDLVLDPFAGSNVTGAAAEELGRRWISIEANSDYAEGSIGRFPSKLIRRDQS
jgi:hypothetical protein